MADFESVLNGISVVNLHAGIVHFEPVMDLMFIFCNCLAISSHLG